MLADCIGIVSVANLIEQTGLTKFTINRYGANKGTTPVYECIQYDQNGRAKKAFIDWAQNVLQGNPNNGQLYELTLFNKNTDLTDDDSDSAAPVKGKKIDKIKINFQLANGNDQRQISGGEVSNEYIRRDDMQKLINEALEKQTLKNQNAELVKRIEALESDDDDDDNGTTDDIISRAERLIDKISGMAIPKSQPAPETEPAAVSGTNRDREEIRANIKTAITRLMKHDSELDKDLLKMADIADKDTDQFKMFIHALRRM